MFPHDGELSHCYNTHTRLCLESLSTTKKCSFAGVCVRASLWVCAVQAAHSLGPCVCLSRTLNAGDVCVYALAGRERWFLSSATPSQTNTQTHGRGSEHTWISGERCTYITSSPHTHIWTITQFHKCPLQTSQSLRDRRRGFFLF